MNHGIQATQLDPVRQSSKNDTPSVWFSSVLLGVNSFGLDRKPPGPDGGLSGGHHRVPQIICSPFFNPSLNRRMESDDVLVLLLSIFRNRSFNGCDTEVRKKPNRFDGFNHASISWTKILSRVGKSWRMRSQESQRRSNNIIPSVPLAKRCTEKYSEHKEYAQTAKIEPFGIFGVRTKVFSAGKAGPV